MISYTPSFIPNKFLIIGCGGTGSRLVPLVAQFIKACNWILDPEITLVDDDIVEPKNLTRQNFVSSDVGKNKAEVLANRYGRAYGVSIKAVRSRVDKDFNIEEITGYGNNSIIIMCVDSPDSRRDILERLIGGMRPTSSSLLIDSGNENDYGQVVISHFRKHTTEEVSYRGMPSTLVGNMGIPFIPMDINYFKDMVALPGGSCADLDQTMAINVAVATSIFSVIQNVCYAKPISFHRIDITLAHGSTPHYMNLNWLRRVKGERTNGYNYRAETNTFMHLSSSDLEELIRGYYFDEFLPMEKLRLAALVAQDLVVQENVEVKPSKATRGKKGKDNVVTMDNIIVEDLAYVMAERENNNPSMAQSLYYRPLTISDPITATMVNSIA